jgi:dienelactone hydrolase
LITSDGEAKIIDFGLAKLAGKTKITKEGSTLGTAAYMSPEQARGEEVDHRSDIFSLGTILYEMIAGRTPFTGEHEAALLYEIVHEEPEPVTSLCPEAPEEISKIIERALKKERSDRYASAGDLLNDLNALIKHAEARAPETVSFLRLLRQPRFAIPGIVLIIVLASLFLWWRGQQVKVRWAQEVALDKIAELAEDVPWTGEGPETWKAYELAMEATQYIPDDPMLEHLWPQFSRYFKIYSDPSGARVYAKPYADVDSKWRYMGETPIDSIRFPSGYSRIKLEKEGFRSTKSIVRLNAYQSHTMKMTYRLSEAGNLPEEMELIPNIKAGKLMPWRLTFPGMRHYRARLSDYSMDRYEVTNESYKRFVDSGGYVEQKYWKYPIVKDSRTLAWEEAMTYFVDKTGRPGPSTWEVGDYPEGEDDHPVAGVSWYEAAAYAEFIGKELPTIYHWDRTAFIVDSPAVIPLSNLNGTSTVPVGSSKSMNRYGVYDLAGNVREWCFNKSSRGEERFILGGGWTDPEYAYAEAYAQHAFDRSETNGFRCIRYLGSEEYRAELEDVIELPFRDFLKEPNVSDAVFATYLKQYAYDKTDLDPVVEYVREEKDWIREKITFNAAYGNERIIVYLYLPKEGTPPYQMVIYFPGITALQFGSSEDYAIPFKVAMHEGSREFLTKSGRAVLFPVYKSTFERYDDFREHVPPWDSHFFKEHVIMWVKDLSRSIDYLETRDDIDANKIAFFGYSWGSWMGGFMAAVEERIKASVLLVGGFDFYSYMPEVDILYYLPRVTSPVLMLNGYYDYYYPYETAQKPFFELLGTPKEDKKFFVKETSHLVPRTDLIRETLAWLDRYLGPVE